MANTPLQIKKSNTPNAVPNDLLFGELAINYADGKLYYKDSTGTINPLIDGGARDEAGIARDKANGSAQLAFAGISTPSGTVTAGSNSDIVSIRSGENINISANSSNNTIVISASGAGDMQKSVYDPNNVEDDAFDRANHLGTQPISSVEDLEETLDGKLDAVNADVLSFSDGERAKIILHPDTASQNASGIGQGTTDREVVFFTGRNSPSTVGQNPWNSVAYGNGMYVAVAATTNNNIMSSPDGINWTMRRGDENSASSWYSVTYGNGLFVAVAYDGTHRVMTSPDGINWTSHIVDLNAWYSVTYGNGLFVAVALQSAPGGNRVMSSPDGVTWTSHPYGNLSTWESVTYGDGVFVAVASTGINRIMRSTDGVTWTEYAAPQNNAWRSVTYGNGYFVAVSSDGTNRVMRSTDGIAWEVGTATQANNWYGVTYGNGIFVAVATSGSTRIMTTADPTSIWTGRTAPAPQVPLRAVTYGDGLFVAVSYSGTHRVITSPDGVTWTIRNSPAPGTFVFKRDGHSGNTIAILGEGGNNNLALINSVPTQNNHVVTKGYVDNQVTSMLSLPNTTINIAGTYIRMGPIRYQISGSMLGASDSRIYLDKSVASANADIHFRDRGNPKGGIGLRNSNNISIWTSSGTEVSTETWKNAVIIYNDSGDAEFTGQIGIGTKPWAKLHLSDNVATRVMAKMENYGLGGSGFEFAGANSNWHFGVDSAQNGTNDFFISDAAVSWPPRLIIDSGGNITTTGTINGMSSANSIQYLEATSNTAYLNPKDVWEAVKAKPMDYSAGTITIDFSKIVNGAALMLTQNSTLAAPLNRKDGQSGALCFTASGSTRTLTLNGNWVRMNEVEAGPYSCEPGAYLFLHYMIMEGSVWLVGITRRG